MSGFETSRVASWVLSLGMAARPRPFLVTTFVVLVCSLLAVSMALAQEPANPSLFGGGGSPDLLSKVERALVEKEYEASENQEGLQAPNRRHGFRAYFEPDGVRLVDRTAPGSPELARVRVASIGRGELQQLVAAGAVSGPGKRVEIARSGAVREHFENTPEGLRHTLTIARRPPGDGDLVVFLGVETAAVERAQEGVALRAPTGRRLEMRRLPVTDSAGTLLASRLEAAGGSRIRFTVAERAAVYPLIVEFLFTGGADGMVHAQQVDAQLGYSVAGAGDVNGDGHGDIIVGAFLFDAGEANEGAAFVFLGTSIGVVSGTPLTASAIVRSAQADANLGYSVSGAGDVNGDGYGDVIVGAPYYDSGESGEGAAFVFLGGPSGVASGNPSGAAATLQSNQADAYLGISVAAAGDVNGDGYGDVIVGAFLYDSGQPDEGAAFVFSGSATGVASGNPSSAATTLQSNQADAYFGLGVATAGDVNGDGYSDVIVGAPYHDSGNSDEGAAFVFLGSPSGVASGSPSTAAASLQSDQANAQLGYSVSAAGDVNGDGYGDVIVGAGLYDSGEFDEGAAFVFLGGASGVASGSPESAAATLQSDQPSGVFGRSVSGAGDVNGDGYADVIVGAYAYNNGESDEGAAFVFLGSATGVASGNPSTAAATLESNQADALFGTSVAGAGDLNGDGYADVIAGAFLYDAGAADEGAAFVFLGSASAVASGSASSAAAMLQANQATAWFGLSVSGAGDVNADGYGDVIVGAPFYDSGQTNEGAAFVFLGSASGVVSGGPASAAATLQSNQQDALLGVSVAGAGDVNGDGYGDVIVGARNYNAGESGEGAVFVFLGSASGVASGSPSTASTILQSNQASALLGSSVAGAGDVNGDGYGDVIVGAQGYDSGETNEGAAFLFLGGAAGVASGSPSTAAATLQSNQTYGRLGSSVSGAGDVNRDGYGDVIVGAEGYDPGQSGAAFVFLGSALGVASGSPSSAAASLLSDQADAYFGISVSGAGDVNGDGYGDVIIGAPGYDSGEATEGAAFVFLGGAAGVDSGDPSSAAATLQSDQVGARLGIGVSGAGDVNGDGYGDVIVGADSYSAGETHEGAAFVFLGGPFGMASGNPSTAAATLQSNQVEAWLGSVSGAGDVDGDGYGDVIVGANLYGSGETNEGAAFVFLGNGGGGRQVRARQLRPGSLVPVAPWGSSRDLDAFDARMFATHPAGGGRVKLELEACLADKRFGDPSCTRRVSSAWSNVTATSGIALGETISGLTASRLYRWRARVLQAPATVVASGITTPPRPSHGPWRRFQAQATEADVRTQNGVFYTLPPCRVVDTRGGTPAPPIGGPVLTHEVQRTFALAGNCLIPPTARAVSLNVTAVNPLGAGRLVIYPTAGAATNTTAVSFNANGTRANSAVFGLNPLGQLQVLPVVSNPSGPDLVHLVVDVNGYFE